MNRRLGGLRGTWRLAAVLAIVLASAVPFAGKAFHIDDVYFIEIAENIAKDPLRPFAGAAALEDVDYRVFAAAGRCPTTFSSMSHPPLVPYSIALLALAFGGVREGPLHLGFDLFAVAAASAIYSLAQRFTRRPLAAALLVVSSPIFVLAGHGLMTDMPALAFASGSLALLVQGVDQDRPGKVIAAGFLAGLAGVTRYSALLVLPLLLAYAWPRGALRKSLPALVGVSAVLGAWGAQNLICNGELHILASAGHYLRFYQGQSFAWAGLVKKALFDLGALGGTACCAGALLLLAGTWRRAVTFATAALAAAAVFIVRPRGVERLETYEATEVVAVACCFGLGVVLLAEALGPRVEDPSARERPGWGSDRAFLGLWLVLSLGGALLLLPFGAARYMLPVLPPLWFLLLERAEVMLRDARGLRLAVVLCIVQGLLLAGSLGVADAQHANAYRTLASSLRERFPRRTLWFVGEWGFRYYMTAVGGRYLRSADESPQAGDLIVRPDIAGMHAMSAGVSRRAVLIEDLPIQGGWPIRLMSFDAKAGYYSHHWGFLPWAWSQVPLETIEVFEVRVPAPPMETPTCASS